MSRGGGARAPLRRGSVVVAGIRSPVVEAGPAGAEQAVVFLHGNPGSSEDWASFVARAGVFARAMALDQPGFGRADKPRSFPHTYAGHASHLARTLDVLGVRRAHLVGHDLGARWGMQLADQHPKAVGGVVLIAGGVLLDYRWHYLARLWRRPLVGEAFMASGTRPVFRLMLRRGNPKRLPRQFVDRMYDEMDARTKRAILSLYRPDSDWNADSYALAGRLRQVPRPALVVWGTHDPYIGVAQAWRQRESLPGAEVVVIERSGHWPFLDSAEQVERVVLDFLAEQLDSPTGVEATARGTGTVPDPRRGARW